MVLLPGWATDGRVFDGIFPGVTAVTTGPLRPEGFRGACGVPRPYGARAGDGRGMVARRVPRGGVRAGISGPGAGGSCSSDPAEYPEGDVAGVPALALGRPGSCLRVLRAMFLPVADARVPSVPLRAAGGVPAGDGRRRAARRAFVPGEREALRRDASGVPRGDRPRREDVVAPLAEAEGVAREGGNATFHPLPGRRTPPSSRTGFARWSPMVDPAVLRRFSAGAARYEARARAAAPPSTCWRTPRRRSLSPHGRTTALSSLPPTGWPQRGRAFKILEPGCGTGLYTRMLLDAFRGASVFGVDISEAMVRVAKRGIDDPRARFAVADAEEIATGSLL